MERIIVYKIRSMSSNSTDELNIAIRSRDIERVRFILSTGVDVNKLTYDFRGEYSTYLHIAPNVEITRELLQHGAHINAADGYHLTPLHYAVTYCKGVNVIRELLDHGAHINAQNHDGFTALTFAILFGNLDVIKELMKHDAVIDLPIASSYFQYSTSLGIAITDYENCAKLIIKATIFKKACDDFHNTIDLEPYRDCSNFESLSRYQKACIKEILGMKLFHINNKLTVYDFIANRSNIKKPLYSNKKNILEEIKINFPIYHDMVVPNIKLCVERYSLLDKLRVLRICTKSNPCSRKQIILDPDSSYKIGEYLTNIDLKSFILAFDCPPSKPDDSFVQLIPLPNSLDEEVHGCSYAKRCRTS